MIRELMYLLERMMEEAKTDEAVRLQLFVFWAMLIILIAVIIIGSILDMGGSSWLSGT